MNSSSTLRDELSLRLHALLPQTQCTRCGYPDCAGYAEALATGEADLNRCAPGGREGIARLADLLRRPPKPLNPAYGVEAPRMMAVIDEDWCIGCTKCLDACPTDAILGAPKRMHTIMNSHCTGCELCIPACPVDCIEMRNESGSSTGWDAWSQSQAAQSLARYKQHSARIAVVGRTVESSPDAEAGAPLWPEVDKSEESLRAVCTTISRAHTSASDQKRTLIEAAIKRARAFKAS